MNNLNTTSKKKEVIQFKILCKNNSNAKIIILDPEKDYEELIKRINDFPYLKL